MTAPLSSTTTDRRSIGLRTGQALPGALPAFRRHHSDGPAAVASVRGLCGCLSHFAGDVLPAFNLGCSAASAVDPTVVSNCKGFRQVTVCRAAKTLGPDTYARPGSSDRWSPWERSGGVMPQLLCPLRHRRSKPISLVCGASQIAFPARRPSRGRPASDPLILSAHCPSVNHSMAGDAKRDRTSPCAPNSRFHLSGARSAFVLYACRAAQKTLKPLRCDEASLDAASTIPT
jgi:hypothetical protein